MTCEWCKQVFDFEPTPFNHRRRFCSRACSRRAWRMRNLPNRGMPTSERLSHYWLTTKGYRAIGKKPPRAVTRTDRDLGILG